MEAKKAFQLVQPYGCLLARAIQFCLSGLGVSGGGVT